METRASHEIVTAMVCDQLNFATAVTRHMFLSVCIAIVARMLL